MFTGLIAETGSVLAVIPSGSSTRITVAAPTLAARLKTGDSIAVSGVCLTALAIEPSGDEPHFSADLAQETIARTTLTHLVPRAAVNLELPTPAGSPLGGHVVQGHVDGTATLIALTVQTVQTAQTAQTAHEPDHPDRTDWRLRLELPAHLTRFVVPQGSITVEGISLTVASIIGRVVEIAIIPHTYAATSLHTLAPGSPLNIEVDVLSKYAAQRETEKRPGADWLTTAYLLANGY